MRPNVAKKITSFMKVKLCNIPQLPKSSGLAKFFGYVLQTVSRLHFARLNGIFTECTGRRRITFLFSGRSSLNCLLQHSGLTRHSTKTRGRARGSWVCGRLFFQVKREVCTQNMRSYHSQVNAHVRLNKTKNEKSSYFSICSISIHKLHPFFQR